MLTNSLRADGWADVAGSLVMAIVGVFFWYGHDLYLNWIVFVTGIGAGLLWHIVDNFADDHPVAGFPIGMLFILAMLVAIHIRWLVAGVVAAFTVATAIKVHEVYL